MYSISPFPRQSAVGFPCIKELPESQPQNAHDYVSGCKGCVIVSRLRDAMETLSPENYEALRRALLETDRAESSRANN
jgi:hypothetical protein